MSDPVEGIDRSDAPYVIVSSDTHAGLFVEDYRQYLDSSVHPQFDEWLTTRHRHRTLVEEVNGEYVAQWERENETGLRGAYDPAAPASRSCRSPTASTRPCARSSRSPGSPASRGS